MNAASQAPNPTAGAASPVPASAVPVGGLSAMAHRMTVGQWAASASGLGIMASICIHILMTGLATWLSLGIAGIGSRGSGGGEYVLDLTSNAQLVGLPETGLSEQVSTPVVSDAPLPELPTAGVNEGSGGFDAPGAGAGLGSVAEGMGGAGGGDVGEGTGIGQGGSGSGAGASFFGVEAKGSRFLFICDISGSMNWGLEGQENGLRIRSLKNELTRSISGLLEYMSFYVVFFNSGSVPINPENNRWILAKDTGKVWAIDRVGRVEPMGGTEPWPAFEVGFTMRPAPDAIYFMTDGNFDPSVAMRIAQVNVGSRKIPIHTITLIDKSGEEVMRKIAADSGGTYTHVAGVR